ncbi:MAG: MCE family protein [Polyangiaceae bacterium]|nr:MCE family protein [Polyangiaceae bacterium]
MSQRSIEVRVGILILVALALLAGFLVVMGGLSFEPTYTVKVDFDNPGGLQSGAPVRIAGVKVGRVAEIQFRGGVVDPATQQPAPTIRVIAKIEKRYQSSITENSRWFVTSQGVLGELFLAVEPGSHDRPALADGAEVRGISPPRLDLLLSESYELLHRTYAGLTKNEKEIGEMFEGLHRTLKGTGDFFANNGDKLDRIVTNVETLTVEANGAVKAGRERYIDSPQVTRIMNNVEGVTASVNRDVPPLLTDGRALVGDARKLTGALASDAQLARYEKITRDVVDTTGHAKVAVADAQALVAHVKGGRGTVGALLMEEALYDDIQEMVRDLKHNPWKFFWRE